MDCLLEVINAIMVTTPWVRLSEDVISKQFYTDRLPLGVAMAALSEKGVRDGVSFKETCGALPQFFQETPSGAKLASIAALKRGLVDAGIDPNHGDAEEPAQATEEDLQQLVPADVALVNIAKTSRRHRNRQRQDLLLRLCAKAWDKETEPVKSFKIQDYR